MQTGVRQKKYKTPNASKKKGEQPLERGVWFKIKGKSQNLPDNNTQDSVTQIKETKTNLQRLIKINLPETSVWGKGGSMKGLSHFNLLRNESKQTQEVIFQI